MLNGLWLGSFLVTAASTLACWLIGGNATVPMAMVESLLVMVKLAVGVMVLPFGVLTLQLGFLRIAKKVGLVERLTALLGPLFRRLMPKMPSGHPAIGSVAPNFAVNGLGLGNVAVLIGLKAMKALQELNPSSTIVSNIQILFLVLDASSLTPLLMTIFIYRAQQGATDPTLAFLPILLATSASALASLSSVALMRRLCLWDPVVLTYLILDALLLADFMTVLSTLPATALAQLFPLLGSLTLFSPIVLFLVVGTLKEVPVYESLMEGTKEGFDAARNLLPYLAAMLCAVDVLRASEASEVVLGGMRWAVEGLGWDSHFVEALPAALVRPSSSSAARAMLPETVQTHGVSSFSMLVAITVQGSTGTIFHVLAVYFDSVGLQRIRHVVGCALTTDLAGVIASIGVCYWFFA